MALVVGLCWAAWHHYRYVFSHETIRELQQTPVGGVVHLSGIVTGLDPVGGRFWLQDETGAIAIGKSPRPLGVHIGESITVEATKTAHYDPVVGPDSVALSKVKVVSIRGLVQLPQPLPVTPVDFPAGDRSDIRVQMTAIVRGIQTDADSRVHLVVADLPKRTEIVLPGPSAPFSQLVDAKVRVIGVPEAVRGESGATDQWIWVSSIDDIHVEEAAPRVLPLVSIRDIYSNQALMGGHRVRIRGSVAATLSPTSLLLDDRWGAIECGISSPREIPAGSAVEVMGFPSADGLRIDILDAQATQIPLAQLAGDKAAGAGIEELKTVKAVRELPQAQAGQALPVRISGVITFFDSDWGQLYLQDATGGIYVKYSGAPSELRVGEKVLLVGLTNAGNFAPAIVAPKFQDQGNAPLPRPLPVTALEASAGIRDSQRVEVEGVIHPIQRGDFRSLAESRHLTFELYSGFGQIHVYASPQSTDVRWLQSLVDARVNIQGVFGTVFNSRRQLVGYQLAVASPSDIQVIEPAPKSQFEGPATPIAELLEFSRQANFGRRVKVRGSVTMAGQDSYYLQDDSGAVEVRGDTASLHPGDLVEALGYPSLVGRYSPVLTDSESRPLGRKEATVAKAVTVDSISQGKYDSRLVSVQGKLLAAITGPTGESLLMQSGIHTFTAELSTTDSGAANWIPLPGSVLRLTGICSAQVDPNKLYLLLDQPPVSFKILLRSPADVALVQGAPFWNLHNAFFVLVTLVLAILVALVWVRMLRKRVEIQTLALKKAAETTQAIQDLSRVMQEVSTLQEFNAHVSVRGSEEVSQLVVGFNRMLSELQKSEQAKREAESSLQHQALTDELTQLPNRRHLAVHLTQSLAAAQRHDSLMALLYIDLDGFKLVNDSLGHAAGDALLVQVAERLRSRIRVSDNLARIGGDEFTVILNSIARNEDAQRVAENMLESLRRPFHVEGHEITVGASIGICIFPDQANDGTDLLQQADSAMYAAKRNGKNQALYFTQELGNSVRERLTLESELRQALENGNIRADYQPEFEIASGRLVRFEALARWTHPTLGPIPPSKFIPIAEECGLIFALGVSIMEQACAEALGWQSRAGRPIQVAVNVSSLQFARESFVDEVIEALNKTGLDPSLLQIELTESAMLIGVEPAARSIQRLHTIGVAFAIDDFGTGLSCLNYLPRMAFQALKIDRAFVKDLIERPETKAMVRSLITLARDLGMKVIAEGIETPEQLKLVEEMGADEAQGYLLGRPTPDPSPLLQKGSMAVMPSAHPQ
jgi:diguanylate cyclase (GGDEF)-like protein